MSYARAAIALKPVWSFKAAVKDIEMTPTSAAHREARVELINPDRRTRARVFQMRRRIAHAQVVLFARHLQRRDVLDVARRMSARCDTEP